VKKFLMVLGVLMILLLLAVAGGSYYAYQHRQELSKKAVSYVMQNMGASFLPRHLTPKQVEGDGAMPLLNMLGGEGVGELNLASMAQNFMSVLADDSLKQKTAPCITAHDLNARDPKGRTLLMNVCRTDASDKVIKMLLQYGADIDATDNYGRTALMYAVALNQNPDVVRMLLANGANKKARDYKGKSVADYAVSEEIRAILKQY
jgi:hypothetical protein